MCAQLDFLLYPEFTRQNRIFIHVYVAKINKKSIYIALQELF